MRRYLQVIAALAFAACAAAASADPPGRVGRVNHVSGPVSFAPAEAPDQWVPAPINRPLVAGDRLWADANGRAEAHVGSTAIRLGPRTSVDVLNIDDDNIQLRVIQGDLIVRVRELPPEDRIEIATPAGAVMLQQPGSYRVSVDPQSASTRVNVNFGQAQIATQGQTLTVPSSQTLWLAGGAPPQYQMLTASSADPLDRWSAERDRREDRVASTRYVSPQMTGYEDLDHYGTWRTHPEYGALWVPTRVAPDWAPYRHGHWEWISPWGWTWIDHAPWGFAPSHYGRWVWVNDHWAWAPGAYVRRPVYAPALVAFVGGTHFTASSGPAVGWFPLGWREPYVPWYRASHRHVHHVNHTHVPNFDPNSTHHHRHAHRHRPHAVTVVPERTFTSARPVAPHAVRVDPAAIARAEVHARPPVEVKPLLPFERMGQRERYEVVRPHATERHHEAPRAQAAPRPQAHSHPQPQPPQAQPQQPRAHPQHQQAQPQPAQPHRAQPRRDHANPPTEVIPRLPHQLPHHRGPDS